MNIDQIKEVMLGLLLWIFGWTTFDLFLEMNKFKVNTKFYISVTGFLITLYLFYKEIKEEEDTK